MAQSELHTSTVDPDDLKMKQAKVTFMFRLCAPICSSMYLSAYKFCYVYDVGMFIDCGMANDVYYCYDTKEDRYEGIIYNVYYITTHAAMCTMLHDDHAYTNMVLSSEYSE